MKITADTTYVASYHSNGHYAATSNFFGATYTNGSLTTPGPAAGVYTYGFGNLFPTSTSNANYWVDVLFVSSGAPVAVNDSGFTTSQGAALEIPSATLLANDTDPTGDPISFLNVVPGVGGSPSYNSATGTVTFTPNNGFIGAATFNYLITDGTNDPVSASVNLTVLPPATIGQLFAYSDTPAILSDPDTSGVNLGVKFLATEAGAITGLKYYKGAGDIGTHVGSLWTSTGTLLASATFTNESASGWQYVTFDSPVSISAATTYVASYHSNGHYTATGNYFTSAYTNGALATPGPSAGVYTYGAGNLFPTSTSNANYWVDVLFAAVRRSDRGQRQWFHDLAGRRALDPNVRRFSQTTRIRTVIRFRWLRSALSLAGRSALPRMLSLSRRHLAILVLRASPIKARTAPTLQRLPRSNSPSCRRRPPRNSLHTRTRRRTSPTQTQAA